MIWPRNNKDVQEAFSRDLEDLHMIYDYDAENVETGAPEKWRYEGWFRSADRFVYSIHGGPMAGRLNYQTADYQCIRPGELWQINWLEETGTTCSMVLDLKLRRVTTMANFSKGHWENAEAAHGNKRNPEDFERWRGLAKIGIQTDRKVLSDQADIIELFRGQGGLEDIDLNAPTL
ncbi:hypothetical protein BCV70DRAFT_202020 [Testicularia cyperi]|uniref:Phenol acid carboxylase n=1 Tax=Testicularia cyperi TaxID=1882483 RepID=A0A317XIW0_9BASI|nr:hypothetical protein BCV70DRAFT_202020 [Testicularia cyperi]